MKKQTHAVYAWIRSGMGLVLGVVLLLTVVTLVAADAADSVLDLEVSKTVVTPGDTFVMTMTLTTPDAEAFGAWQVHMSYDDTVLTVGDVWVSEDVVPAGLDATVTDAPPDLYVSDAAFSDNAGSSAPYLLATVEFTATSAGSSAFEVIVDPATPANDTFYGPAGLGQPRWIPGIINVPEVTVADYQWTGAIDTDWHTAGNWTPNTGTPGASDTVAIPGGLSSYPVLEANGAVDALYILPGGMVEIPAAYALTAETVDNQGDLVLWKNVDGGVRSDFHLYDSSLAVSYYGLEITPNGAMNTTSVRIGGHQDCTNRDEPGDTADRCYDVTPGQQPTDATARFYYLDTELDGQEPTTMQVWHWNTGTMTWTSAGTATPSGSAPDYYVDVSGITDFSPFVLKSGTGQPTRVSIRGVQGTGGLTALGALALGLVAWLTRKRQAPQESEAPSGDDVPYVIAEGDLEVQAGSPLSIPDFEDWEDL